MTGGDLEEIRAKARRRNLLVTLAILAILVIVFLVAIVTGPSRISLADALAALVGIGDDSDVYIIHDLRLPRILCCAFVGAALSVAGVAMQGLFRNPMASPSILGVSSGAAFGAALAIGLGMGSFLGSYSTTVMAFVFCMGTMFLVYILARVGGGVSTTMLLLSGVAVGAFFNSMVSAIQYFADTNTLPSIVYWLMGSFSTCGWNALMTAMVPILVGILLILFKSQELNLISLGEEQAESLGVNVKAVRITVLIATSLMVAGAVAISGIIGFVGLIIPHIFRMLVGPDHRILLPLSIVGGAAFMIFMDAVARWAISPNELPIGILTAALGAPFFIYVMRTRRNYKMGAE